MHDMDQTRSARLVAELVAAIPPCLLGLSSSMSTRSMCSGGKDANYTPVMARKVPYLSAQQAIWLSEASLPLQQSLLASSLK